MPRCPRRFLTYWGTRSAFSRITVSPRAVILDDNVPGLPFRVVLSPFFRGNGFFISMRIALSCRHRHSRRRRPNSIRSLKIAPGQPDCGRALAPPHFIFQLNLSLIGHAMSGLRPALKSRAPLIALEAGRLISIFLSRSIRHRSSVLLIEPLGPELVIRTSDAIADSPLLQDLSSRKEESPADIVATPYDLLLPDVRNKSIDFLPSTIAEIRLAWL